MSTQEAIGSAPQPPDAHHYRRGCGVAVVAGAFVFSDLVMMRSIWRWTDGGAAMDATVVRMF